MVQSKLFSFGYFVAPLLDTLWLEAFACQFKSTALDLILCARKQDWVHWLRVSGLLSIQSWRSEAAKYRGSAHVVEGDTEKLSTPRPRVIIDTISVMVRAVIY